MEPRIKITAHPGEPCTLGPNWWLFALRGLAALGFGCLALRVPMVTVQALTVLFGAFAAVDGIFHLVSGLNQARRGRRWGGLVAGGVLGIAAGLVMLVAPHWATLGLTLLLWATVSVWAISGGVALIAASTRLRREIHETWMMAMNGAVLVALGIGVMLMFWVNPAASIVSLAFLLGLAGLSAGVLNLLLAYRLFRQTGPAVGTT